MSVEFLWSGLDLAQLGSNYCATASARLTYLGRLQIRHRASAHVIDLTGNFAASLDLNLPIANLPGNLTSGPDQQTLGNDQIAVEGALYIGVLG
jgi:hypothetical protein